MDMTPNGDLAQFGVKLSHIVAGIAGGAVRAFMVGNSLFSAVGSVVIGALTSAYMTSPVSAIAFKITGIPENNSTEHSVAFVVGLTAMLLCEGVLRYVRVYSRTGKPPTKDDEQ